MKTKLLQNYFWQDFENEIKKRKLNNNKVWEIIFVYWRWLLKDYYWRKKLNIDKKELYNFLKELELEINFNYKWKEFYISQKW